MKQQQSGFVWHARKIMLLEWCRDYDKQAGRIPSYLPSHELELHLRLFQSVKGELPQGIIEARNIYDEACNICDEAREAYNKAWNDEYGRLGFLNPKKAYKKACDVSDEASKVHSEALRTYNEVLSSHKDEIEALHAMECPNCPWGGEIILPKRLVAI